MKKGIFILLLLLCTTSNTYAQVGRKVQNIELHNLDGGVSQLPHFGVKTLVVFYVDPDRAGQNDQFIQEIKGNTTLRNGMFSGVNILNLKDAPMVGETLAVKMAKKRAETSGTPFLLDKDGELAKSWRLGDCDNQSVVMLINPSGEILFISKGKISDNDKSQFFKLAEEYK